MRFRKLFLLGLALVTVLALGVTFVLAQSGDDNQNGAGQATPTAPDAPDAKLFDEFVPGEFMGRRGFGRGMSGMSNLRAPLLEIVAEQLDMTTDAVRSALAEGTTIAELAEANGVDVQVIIDAAVAEAAEHLQIAVENGRITQEEADAVLDGMADMLAVRVNESWQTRGFAPGLGHMGRGAHVALLDIVATELDLTLDEVRSALADGTTIAELAEANGVDVQVIVDAAVARAEEWLQTAVDSGRITQEQADAMLAQMAEHLAEQVNEPWPAAGPCPEGFGRGGAGRGGFGPGHGMGFHGRGGGFGPRGGGFGPFNDSAPEQAPAAPSNNA